jgi:hypothetical protein
MTEPIKDPVVHKVEVKRRIPEARIAAENIYRAFGIKNPHEQKEK